MIECKNIRKIYSSSGVETAALAGVSFQIEEGEFVAIMGPSGSGKSTLMHILGALDTATSGEYLLDGKNISQLSDDELADIRKNKIGFIFQSFNLLPRITVIKNVILPLMYTNMSRSQREQVATECLAKAGLNKDHFLYFTNQLSGGQMQRVAIARALTNNPSLILADEPTGNLDTQTGEIVLKTFQDLNRKHNSTVVLITHDHHVAQHADRIITIQDGTILSDEINKAIII